MGNKRDQRLTGNKIQIPTITSTLESTKSPQRVCMMVNYLLAYNQNLELLVGLEHTLHIDLILSPI